jgi:hypothetical protein
MRAVVIARPQLGSSPAVAQGWGYQHDRYFSVVTAAGQTVSVAVGRGIPADTPAGTAGELVWEPLNGKPTGKIMRPRFRPDLCSCGQHLHADGKCFDCLAAS